MNKETEARKNVEVFIQRQMLFYQNVQNIIFEEAQRLAEEFYVNQKALSDQARKDNKNREWSDLSIAVRKSYNNCVTIYWRIRIWYKSADNDKPKFNAQHISKARNSHNYKKALAKHATAAEYNNVMELEDQFVSLRNFSTTVRDAQRRMLNTAKALGFSIKNEHAFVSDKESVLDMHEQIGNLILLLRYRLWPIQTEADLQAGFIPLINPQAGLRREVDPRAVHTALQKIEEAHRALGNLLLF